jgi:hypothetical protein
MNLNYRLESSVDAEFSIESASNVVGPSED